MRNFILLFSFALSCCSPAYATFLPQSYITDPITGDIAHVEPSKALDVFVTNASSSTVTQGPAGVSPWLFNLSQYGGVSTTLGQKTMASSIPIAIASNQSAIPVTVASLPLPSNAAQESGGHLASIDTKLTAPISTSRTWSLSSGSDSVSAVVSGSVGVTQTTSPWITSDLAGGSVSGGSAGSKSILAGGIYNTSAPTLTNGQQASLQFDVNGNLKITPAGGSTSVTQGTSPWVDNISQFGGSNVVTGTGASGLGIPRVTVSNDSNILVTQSGAWPVTANAGTNLNTSLLALDSTVAKDASLSTINTSINTLLKPANTLAAVTTLGSITSALPAGSNTIGKVDQGASAAVAWKVDGSSVTQPVSGTVTANAGTNLNTSALALSATQTNGTQKAQNVDGSGLVNGPYQTLSGTNYLPVVTASSVTPGSALAARSIQVAGSDGVNAQNISVDSTGKLNVSNISGVISLPTGAATSANQTNASQKTQIVDGSGTVIGSNYGSATNGIRVAAQIGNASAVADFNSGATSIQTLRVAANNYDGFGSALTSTTQNSKVGVSVSLSGQDPLTGSGTGSALNATPVPDTVVTQYHCASIQHSLTGTNTITFEGSNDDTTWTSIACQNNAVFTTGVSTTAAAALFYCPLTGFQHFRTRISAFTSGTATDAYAFTPLPCDSNQQTVAVNGTVTVSGTVNTNPGVQVFSAQVASAARTTSGNSGNITQGAPNNQLICEANVTAVSGTNPTLDLSFLESPDNGTTFVKHFDWERITGTGQFYLPNIVADTNRFRFDWVIGGTTPSFTFTISCFQGNQVGQMIRRFFDRTIGLNSAATTTASFLTDGCMNYNITLNDSGCATFPILKLQLSEDGTNWASASTTLTTTANGTFISSTDKQQSHNSRVIVDTAGSTCTLGYVALRCTQY